MGTAEIENRRAQSNRWTGASVTADQEKWKFAGRGPTPDELRLRLMQLSGRGSQANRWFAGAL